MSKTIKILLLGSNGAYGEFLLKKLHDLNFTNITAVRRGKLFKKIDEVNYECDCNNDQHLERLFRANYDVVIDLIVSRNKKPIIEIRDEETSLKDILRCSNLMNKLKFVSKYIFISSVSVNFGQLTKVTHADLIFTKIFEFITSNKQSGIFSFYDPKFEACNTPIVDPKRHMNRNLRLNGWSKYICENIIQLYCGEKKINYLIIRPYRIVYDI